MDESIGGSVVASKADMTAELAADTDDREETTVLQWDEDVRAVLAARRARPTLQELGVERSRTMLEQAPLPSGPEMRSVRSTEFDGPHGRVPVRIYTPEGSVSPAPALVWFHGGGMIMGSLESWDHLARALAVASGAVVVNVGYRLAPEHRYPVANDEAYAAVEWVAAQHVSLGLDPARIAVGGDSAGGSLAAATALRARDAGGPTLVQQVLVYPGIERRSPRQSMVEFADSPFLCATDVDWMKSLYLGDDPTADDQYGVPALADDLSGLPAAIVVSARFDPLRDGVEEFGVRLRDAGVATALLRYPGVGHGFLVQVGSFARADTAVAEIGALVRARFSRPPAFAETHATTSEVHS